MDIQKTWNCFRTTLTKKRLKHFLKTSITSLNLNTKYHEMHHDIEHKLRYEKCEMRNTKSCNAITRNYAQYRT